MRRTTGLGLACGLLALAFGGSAAVAAEPARVPIGSPVLQEPGTPIRYVLAGATGATLRNLPDAKGRDVLRVSGDTPLAVYAEKEGFDFLKVAVPGGVKVWIYGQYLQESQRPGWVEVTGSYINMRPRPQTQQSYPLGQLDRGDRLRLIQRQDPTKPLNQDWVQVYSPPDTMAYVLAAETRALPASADAQALWDAAVRETLAGRPEVALGAVAAGAAKTAQGGGATPAASGPASGSGGASGPGVFAKLAEANAAMDAALAASIEGTTPDYATLFALYQGVIALGPDASTRNLVDERVKRLELHRDLSLMRDDLENQKQARAERLEDLKAEAEKGRRGHDPLWGRFQTRGWLERQIRDGEKVFLVRWGSDFIAQVQCSSRRYELDLYDGYEIGVQGVPVNSARAESGAYPLVDIDRIEVISARMRER